MPLQNDLGNFLNWKKIRNFSNALFFIDQQTKDLVNGEAQRLVNQAC